MYLSKNTSWSSNALVLTDREEVTYTDEQGRETTDVVDRDGYAVTAEFEGGKRPVYWGLTWNDVSADFLPDLGYVPRRDIRGPSAWIEVNDYPDSGPLREYGLIQTFTLYENHDGETRLRDHQTRIEIELREKWEFWLKYNDEFHAPFRNHETRLDVNFNKYDLARSVSAGYARGLFEEVPYDEFSLEKPFKIGDRFTSTIEGSYRLEYPNGGRDEVWLVHWVNEYAFAWDARLKLTLERTSEDRHNVTLLFSWLPTKEWNIYAVLNSWQSDGVAEHGAFAKIARRF